MIRSMTVDQLSGGSKLSKINISGSNQRGNYHIASLSIGGKGYEFKQKN